MVVVLALGLVFGPGLALAAAPETPEITGVQAPVHATDAVVEGVLQPHALAPGEAGTYRFLYKAGAVCTGGSATTPGISGGVEHEVLPAETLSGLSAGTKYAVCLEVKTPGGEATSPPVSFTTATPPEKPVTAAAKEATATTVKLEGTVNPAVEAVTGYYFAYSTAAKCTEGSATTPVAPAKVKDLKTPVTLVTGLEPSRKYVACLVAENEAGETAAGNEVSFTTLASKPSIESESASGVKGSEARLEGVVNPNNQTSECKLRYGTEASLATGTDVLCEPSTFPAEYGGQAVAKTVTGLSGATTYYYRVIASNGSGLEEGVIEHFTTKIPPETPETGKAEPLTATSTTLHAVLNPAAKGETGSYQFLYNSGESECTNGVKTPEPAGEAKGVQKEAVQAAIVGLYPGSTYTFCVLQTNSVGETAQSSNVTFTTPIAPPAVVNEFVSNVESGDATLEAEVSPDGAETTYHFEYGPTTSYGTSTPQAAIEGTTGTTTVRAHITGLTPNTVYHYRIHTSNSQSPADGTPGADRTLTTPIVLGTEPSQNCVNEKLREEQPYGLKLPDCRAYEQVSPLDTEGQDATDSFAYGSPRAAISGEAVAYVADGAFANPEGEERGNQFLSRRGPEGWSTQDITPLHDPWQTEALPSYEGNVFTPELTAGIANSNAPLVEGATGGKEQNDFGIYVVGLVGSRTYAYLGEGSIPVGASTDLSHVVFGAYGGLREWVDGVVTPVGVANNGESLSSGVGQFDGFDAWHRVSANGRRVYFSGSADGQLYLRENGEQPQSPMSGEACLDLSDACTVEVSASQKTNGSGPGGTDPAGTRPANYSGASADGSKVFFTSASELTNDAYTGPADNAANLYEYEPSSEPGEPGRLTDLTVDASGDGAAVQAIAAMSEDGSYVYYIAEGVLAAGATAGQPNLYVSHDAGGPVFIATLAEDDREDWDRGSPGANAADASPDGSRLVFLSERSLTGYDNEQAAVGECEGSTDSHEDETEGETGHCREAFLYDAETGTLVCASCNPSGARPLGPSKLTKPGGPELEYQAHNLAEDGALFFDSSDALVPHTSDGRENVYEYENGHVYAISDVAGGYKSFFMDASPNGENVFIASADQMLSEDTSNNVAVWDARVDGGFPVKAPPPPCNNGDECKPPPTPQPTSFGPTPSATFSGPGNVVPSVTATVVAKVKSAAELRAEKLAKALKACKKDKSKKKRVGCEKSAHKRYGAKAAKAKRANNDRRASR